MHSLLRLLKSARLGLGLLLGLALIAGIGTIPGNLKNTFSSPLFLAVVAVLLANIVACTTHRFRLHRGKSPLLILDVLMHLAILVLVIGAVLRVVIGSVGTMSIQEGQEALEIYDWGSRRTIPLEFTLRVKKVVMEHYPMVVKVGVRDAGSGDRIALLEILEGSEKIADGPGVGVRLLGVDRVEERIGCLVRTPAGEGRIRLDLRSGPGATADYGGYRFTLVAFRDEIKMVRALLSTRSADGSVVEHWLAPNERVRVGGANLFLTAWKTDPFGNHSAGLQVTTDPAAPVFWAGCLLFVAALVGRTVLKFRGRG